MGVKRIILLIVLIFLAAICNAQPVDVHAVNSTAYKTLNSSTAYLRTDSLISLDSVIQPGIQKRFEPLEHKAVIFLGYDPHYYWYRFCISNKDSIAGNFVLLLGGLGIRKAELWKKKNGQWNTAGITGYQYSMSERAYRYVHPSFSLRMEPASIDTFLVQIDESHAYKSVSFILVKATSMQRLEHKFYYLMGIITGLLLLFSLFNLYLFFTLKEKIHLWYALYIFMMLLFVIKEEGIDPEFLGLDSFAGYRATSMLAVASLAIGFLLQMVQSFLINIRKSKMLFRSMLYLKWFLFLMAGIQFAVFYSQPSNTIENIVFYTTKEAGLAAIPLIIIACIYSFRLGFKPALFLFAGQLLFLAGVVLRNLFIGMDRHVFPPSVFEVGLIVEIIIISYGLMYRYNQYKKEKERLAVELQEQKIRSTAAILNAQEQEQKRIAADLHDELGGNLAAIKMTMQSFHLLPEQEVAINRLIDTASDNARHIAHDLMPPEFETTSLQVLLEKFYQRVNTEKKISFQFYDSGYKHQFSKQEDLMIYRIIMELTNNIVKHSGATEATIQLVYHEKLLTLMAEDNGNGFGQSAEPGMGPKNIYSRVSFLNGTINTDSGKGGTTTMIQIPFKENQWIQ